LKIKLNDNEYTIKPTYGKFKKIFKMYDFSKVEEMTMQEANEMFLRCFWTLIERRWFGLKPFIFYWNFQNNVTMYDLRDMAEIIPKLLSGEDRNLGNSA